MQSNKFDNSYPFPNPEKKKNKRVERLDDDDDESIRGYV